MSCNMQVLDWGCGDETVETIGVTFGTIAEAEELYTC